MMQDEGNEVGLILFVGGPLDGTAYETKSLLGTEALNIPVMEYKWTSEKRKSEKTDAVAQVWKHFSLVGETASGQPESLKAPEQYVAEARQKMIDAGEDPDRVVYAAQVGEQLEANREQEQTLTDADVADLEAEEASIRLAALEQTSGTDTSAGTAPVSQDASVAQMGDLPDGADLERRRKALKLSVGALAERTGLAHSKIGSIEKGTGKRVKPEEVRVLADAIAQLEAERGGASAHS
jgi:hypothetical protein